MHAIYIVYKIRDYSKTGGEHNYLFNCGKELEFRAVCFLSDRKTMRIYGAKPTIKMLDIDVFHTSYHNPCEAGRWNVLCIIFNTKFPKASSVWLNHGKLLDFECRVPMPATERNFFTADLKDVTAFNGWIGTIEIYPYFTIIPEEGTAAQMMHLCQKYDIPREAPLAEATHVETHVLTLYNAACKAPTISSTRSPR